MRQSDFEINDIATYEPFLANPNSSINDVRDVMKKEDYTVTGVKNQSAYVRRDDLEDESGSVKNFSRDISMDNIVHPEIGFNETLDALYENLFYFIGGRDSIDAIVTRADLNKKPVRNYLFRELVDFENTVEEYIHEHVNGWESIISYEAEERVNDRFKRAKQDNVQLEKIEYANFRPKMRILYRDDSACRTIGYENKAYDDLDGIIRLRNDVAHGHPIIHSMSSKLDVEERTVLDLNALLRELESINSSLDGKM